MQTKVTMIPLMMEDGYQANGVSAQCSLLDSCTSQNPHYHVCPKVSTIIKPQH